MKTKRILIGLLLLVSAVLLGEFAGRIFEDISALSWLAYTISVGIPATQPFVLDLSVLSIAFGAYLSINIAQIILLVVALFLYKPLLKRL